jgi:iron complex outermembrane receptor protein
LSANGYDIFNRKNKVELSARPNTKVLLGMNYDLKNTTFNNTYCEVTWQHATDIKDQTFAGKVITDLGIAYKFTSTLSANVMVNNLLNVYPDLDTKGDVVTDLEVVLNMHGSEPIRF